MKRLIQMSALLWLVSNALAQQTLNSYDWQDLNQHHQLRGGAVVSLDGESVLKIENTNDTPLQVQLLKIVKPAVSTTVYAITGRVKYESVQGTGYLEMWNYFPALHPGMPEGRYFSRTLGDSGEMGKISGTSDWRDFTLPFDPAGASGPPTRLVINLILPGRGTVYLSSVRLVKYPAAPAETSSGGSGGGSSVGSSEEPKSRVLAQYYINETVRLVTLDGQSVYKFENTNDTQLQIQLLSIRKPRLSTTAYAVIGQVKYDDVQGAGYLEMWNYFSPAHPGMPEDRYFSRTLGDSGEMGKISGTCGWRDFMLPFDPAGASGPPTRLEINLILPGRGTVYLTPVKLVKYSGSFAQASSGGSGGSNGGGSGGGGGGGSGSAEGLTPVAGWWSANAAPWVGGIGGPIIGFMGGLLGWLSQKGVARTFVLTAWKCGIAFGLACLIATIIAIIVGQPWFVAMPLSVFGFVSAVVFSTTWPAARKRYDEVEIRRMASMDVT
jgi:hypothetical protein